MIYTVENTAMIGKQVAVRRNGKLVKNCFYADTEKGIVKSYGRRARLNKNRDGVIAYINHGRVVVTHV